MVLSVFLAVWLSQQEAVRNYLLSLGKLDYFGAFLGGILFSSTFTVSFSLIILIALAKSLSPIVVSLIAGFGAMAGSFLFLHLFRDEIVRDLEPIYEQLGGNHLHRILHTKYFAWTLPIIGAIIIASPLPDEIGVSLLGLSRMRPSRFLLLSFFLNTIGIFIIVTVGNLL